MNLADQMRRPKEDARSMKKLFINPRLLIHLILGPDQHKKWTPKPSNEMASSRDEGCYIDNRS
jgi:hypothetical protein